MDSFATRLSSTEERIMNVPENKIMEINTKLELKTAAILEQTASYANKVKGYSDLVKGSTTKESYPIVTHFKKIMAGTLNEQKIHDKEAEKREKYIIIHGVPEDHKVTKDQLQNSDTSYVIGIFEEALQVNVQPVMCRRLGNPSQETGGMKKAHPPAGGIVG